MQVYYVFRAATCVQLMPTGDVARCPPSSPNRQTPLNCIRAQTAIANSDDAALRAAAHAIKGSCGNIGIARLSELGRLLEETLQSAAIATELLTEMTAEFHRARAQLVEIVAQD